MKRLSPILILPLAAFLFLFALCLTPRADAQQASFLLLTGSGDKYLKPVNALWGLQWPGLATSTTGCLSVATGGWISASGSACGSGSGGFSTTSTDYWKTQRNFFSTSSQEYWNTQFRDWQITSGQLAPTTTLGVTVLGWDVGTTTALVCKEGRACNYTTIQSAIDDGWTDILVKNGTYAEQITFSKAKTRLRAESLNTIIQCNGSTQSPCISSGGFDEATIQGFTINEANAALTGVGIDFSNSSIFRILDNRVNNFATSTRFLDTTNETFYGAIERNTFFNPRTCIEFGGTQPNANSSAWNRCRPMQSPLAGFGIYLADTRGFTSTADDFEGTSTSNGVTGIYVATTSREITFLNPWVEANATGILVDTGANRVTFQGGSITSNGTDITDNGTNTVFLNTSDTGVLTTKLGNATTTSLGVTNLSSALLSADGSGSILEYAGASCTNQVVTALSAAGGATCTTITSSFVDSTIVASTRTLTVAGTANQITSSAGAQDLSANRTWTLSLPSHVIFPGDFQATNTTTTNATTTSLYITDTTASRALFTASDNKITTTGTVGAIESSVGSQNILLETEIDGCSELAALLDAETGGCNGTTGPVFPDAPTFSGLTTLANASSTLFSTNYASSTLWYGGGLLSNCDTGNVLTWTAGVFGCATDQVGAAGALVVSTSTNETAGHVPYWTTTSGTPAKLGSLATSTPAVGTGISYSGTLGNFLGGTSGTLTATLGTTVAPNELVGQASFSTNNLLYINTSAGTFASVATTSLAIDGSLSNSGTLGAQVGGTASTLSLNMANANTWTALQTFANSTTTLASFTYASTTDAVIGRTLTLFGSAYTTLASLGAALVNAITAVTPTGTWDFGGATSVEIPNGTGPTVDAIGETALDTTQNETLIATSTTGTDPIVIKPYEWKGFAFGTSTQGSGTTTKAFFIAPPSSAGYMDEMVCHSNSFMRVVLKDEAGNRMNDLIASSTEGVVKLTTNQAFTGTEVILADTGTTTNIAANVYGTCWVKIFYTRN